MNRVRVRLLLLGIALVSLGVAFWRPLAIEYHKRALERTNLGLLRASTAEAVAGIGASSDTESGQLAVAERHHCEALVSLGYFFYDSYTMDKVPMSPESHRMLVVLWPNASPNYSYSRMSQDFTFNVYDLHSNRTNWESFVQRYNRPDLVAHYGASLQTELGSHGHR